MEGNNIWIQRNALFKNFNFRMFTNWIIFLYYFYFLFKEFLFPNLFLNYT